MKLAPSHDPECAGQRTEAGQRTKFPNRADNSYGKEQCSKHKLAKTSKELVYPNTLHGANRDHDGENNNTVVTLKQG